MPSPVRYAAVKKMLEAKGYTHARTAGSHHIFTKPGVPSESIPVHKGLVKHGYVKRIAKL